jgi:hypothetical protein
MPESFDLQADVKEHDINSGIPCSHFSCPWALAAARALGEKFPGCPLRVEVGKFRFFLVIWKDGDWQTEFVSESSMEVRQWIFVYDRIKQISPMSETLRFVRCFGQTDPVTYEEQEAS